MSGSPSGSGFGSPERLDGADQVVAEEADGAAGEGRQALDRGAAGSAQVLGDGRVGVRRRRCGRCRRRRLAAPLREHPVAPAQHRARPDPDERVAADLALLGGLEQEAGRPLRLAGAQLEEGGDGRLAVVDEAGADGHDVALLGQLPGLLEARLEPQLAVQPRRPLSTSITARLGHLARGQQHAQVVEQVGGLLGDPLVGLLAAGAHRPPRPPPRPSRRSASGRRAASPCSCPRAARRRGCAACAPAPPAPRGRPARALAVAQLAVEAAPLARVAGGPGRLDQGDDRVAVAVEPQLRSCSTLPEVSPLRQISSRERL